MNEVDPLELAMQLTDRIDELDFNISLLKDQVNAGKLKLRDFEIKRKEIEAEKEDIKKRIFYIKKGMPEKKRRILDEFNLILEKYQISYENSAIFRISVFFHYSIDRYYEVKLDFGGYPRLPQIEIPPEMIKITGPLVELNTIKNYKVSNPFHVKEILDEISEKVERINAVLNEIDRIKQNFVFEELDTEFKLRVILWSMGEEFPIILNFENFPNLPIMNPSPKLKKYINIQDLSSVRKWNPASPDVVRILKEISFRLDRKFRLELELNELKNNGFMATIGSDSQSIKIQVAATTKSPQAIFSIRIPPNYPTSPPDIVLINSLNNTALEEEINNLINDAVIHHEINFSDLFLEIKELLISKSKEVCSYCKHLKCPICGKDLIGSIEGVSGEYECNTRCPTCGSLFHVCCWKELSTHRQECSVCGSHIRIF
ncbi:MAG: RING finger protein [Candidatus Helarchaeota archaeon]